MLLLQEADAELVEAPATDEPTLMRLAADVDAIAAGTRDPRRKKTAGG